MIRGKIETHEYADGSRLHRGECVVKRESITAGTVMSNQIPDGPPPGFERVTLSWVNTQDAQSSSCRFEILDRRPTPNSQDASP